MRPTPPPPQRLPEIHPDVRYAFKVGNHSAEKAFRRWLDRQNKLTHGPIQTPNGSSSDMPNSVISSPLGDTGISNEIISLGLDTNSVSNPTQRLRSPLTPTPPAGSPKRPAGSPKSRSAASPINRLVSGLWVRVGRPRTRRPDSRSPTQKTPTPPLS